MRIYPLVMGWASEATKNCQRNWWFHRQALNFLGVLDMPSVECWDLPTPSERFRCFSELIKTRFGWLCAKSRLAKSEDFASEDVQHISTYVFFHIHISTFHTHTHIYIYICIPMHFHNFPDAVYMSIHFPCFFVSLSLSLSLSIALSKSSAKDWRRAIGPAPQKQCLPASSVASRIMSLH